METTINNSISKIAGSVLGILIFLAAPVTLLAQQNQNKSFIKEHKKKQKELQKKADQNRNQLLRRSGIDLGSLGDKYAKFTKDQSWMYGNPRSDFQTPPDQSGQWAGDINGDGLGDYIIRARPDGAQTIVYYGGNTSITPDQVLESWLSPIGDINGDGYTDAVTMGGDIYLGSSSGYQNSGNQINMDVPRTFGEDPRNPIIPAGDLNGDGLDDLIHYEPFYGSSLYVIWGDSSDYGQTFSQYNIGYLGTRDIQSFVASSGNFNADSTNELYLFGESSSGPFVRVYDINATKELTIKQDFDFTNSLGPSVIDHRLQVLDIDDNGFDEIFLRPSSWYGSDYSYVFTEDPDSSGIYNTTARDIYYGSAWPVGDLNDDGRIDFHVEDPENGDSYLAYGPQDLSTDTLEHDVSLQWSSSEEAGAGFSGMYPNTEMGDIDGDGIDDYVLGYANSSAGEIGRAFVYGNTSGDPTTDKTTVPTTQFRAGINSIADIGDVNGDGIEDFAVNRWSSQEIAVYYGGSSISGSPDVILDGEFTWTAADGDQGTTTALDITGADFNGDGYSDIIVSTNVGSSVNIFLGGNSISSTPDHRIVGEDFKQDGGGVSTLYFAHNVGDVNNDGVDDLVVGSLLGGTQTDSTRKYYNEAYLFFGGSSMPASPDKTLELADHGNSIYAGWEAADLGDVNGDGVDDFALSSPYDQKGNVDVFYGDSTGSISTTADVTISYENQDIFGLGYGLTGGDFNGDGYGDLAVSKRSIPYGDGSSSVENSNIEIFLGGPSFDDQADQFLSIDPKSVGLGSDRLTHYWGTLSTIPDHDGNGTDELLAFEAGMANAVGFGNLKHTDQQTFVLKSTASNRTLGNAWSSGIGDFTDNGSYDVITNQSSKATENIDVAHRYEITKPIGIASVEDVPNDQGGWVRVKAKGYYMDALDKDIIGFDHWAVWRQDGDKWTNVATIPAFTEDAQYVDVHVPNTKATGSTADSTTYNFKITAENKEETQIVSSDIHSGYALDNIPPKVVTGVSAQRSYSKVDLSWKASEEDALYEVLPADNQADNTLLKTAQTSVSLPDSSYSGVKKLVVRARDINNNTGKKSEPQLAVFPKKLSFETEPKWKLVGVPLDAEQEEIAALLENIEGEKLYEYDGSYQQVSRVDQIEAGKGYWAKFPSDERFSVTGLPLTKLKLEVDKGWNLISGLGETLSFENIEDPDEILVKGTLFGYDNSYNESDKLNPASGYWVRATQQGTVTLSLLNTSTGTKSQKEKSKNILAETKENLNKIKFTTEEGSEQTLYFGKELPEEVNRISFSLPPLPPGNSFDARFAGDATSYKSGNQFTVSLQSANSSNIKVDLQLLSTSKHKKYKIQELKGDQILAEYELTGQDSRTLKNKGVTSLNVSPVGEQSLTENTPEEFKLQPSYPNPFNPSTTIQYQIPEQVQVSVEVFNMVGKKVRTLLAGEQQEAGTHKIRFDASSLSSGVYFVRLKAGSFKQIQKITLIK